MASQVTTRGQITIDRAVREHLGVEPGMVAHQRVVGNRLEVIFLPAPHRRSLSGALHRPGESPAAQTSEQIEEAVREALVEKHSRPADA